MWSARESKKRNEISQIIATVPKLEDQIDAIAVAIGWFSPDPQTKQIIDSYISASISVHQAVDQLAAPVERAYNAALNGRRNDPDGSAEGGLWALWFGVLHAAKKAPWDLRRNQDQLRLLELVQLFKTRQDLISQDHVLSYGLATNWVFEDRRLWSNLKLLGPSARECWNDSPDYGSGCTEPEVQAWCNISAFVARLSLSNTANFWNYGIWAMRDAVEGGGVDVVSAVDENNDRIALRAALVWLRVAGEQMWEKSCKNSAALERDDFDAAGTRGVETGLEDPDYVKSRWSNWRKRFKSISESMDNKWSDGSKAMALEAAELMEEIERKASISQ